MRRDPRVVLLSNFINNYKVTTTNLDWAYDLKSIMGMIYSYTALAKHYKQLTSRKGRSTSWLDVDYEILVRGV